MRLIQLLLLCTYFSIPHNLFIGIDFLAGIKPSDIITLLLIITLLYRKKSSIPYEFLLLPLWYLVRSIFSVNNIGLISLAFGSKFIEYILVIYAISGLCKKQKYILLNSILIATLLFTLLEYFGIFWGQDWAGRYSAQYGGPYELGAVALLLIFVYKKYIVKIFYLALIILSGSKASILGLVFSYIYCNKISFRKFILIVSLIGISLLNDRVQDLLGSTAVFLSSNIIEMIKVVPYSHNNIEYLNNWLLREEYSQHFGLDWSTGSRIYTYILAIRSLDIIGVFFGMGPGYFGYAIDSSILRVFVETGIFGLGLFIIYYKKLFIHNNNNTIKIAIFVNLLLVDVLFSARFYPILFLCYTINYNLDDEF